MRLDNNLHIVLRKCKQKDVSTQKCHMYSPPIPSLPFFVSRSHAALLRRTEDRALSRSGLSPIASPICRRSKVRRTCRVSTFDSTRHERGTSDDRHASRDPDSQDSQSGSYRCRARRITIREVRNGPRGIPEWKASVEIERGRP